MRTQALPQTRDQGRPPLDTSTMNLQAEEGCLWHWAEQQRVNEMEEENDFFITRSKKPFSRILTSLWSKKRSTQRLNIHSSRHAIRGV